jgi:hypothetical protein
MLFRSEFRQITIRKHFGRSFTSALPDFSGHFGFGLQRSANGYVIGCPHWALAALSAGIGTALATRSPCRFSLRTLLIAMTLVALMLGAVAIAAQ